jgi:hypothetical protein
MVKNNVFEFANSEIVPYTVKMETIMAEEKKSIEVKTISEKTIKVGAFGIDLEVPISGVTEWASKIGKSTFTTVIMRNVLKWQTKNATEEAWESLGRSSEILGLAVQHYMQQGAVPRDVVESLNQAIALDAENPPASTYSSTFVLPAERRLQLAWDALEKSQKTSTPLKSFGEFLSDNAQLRDAIYSESERTWRKIEQVRRLVLSQVKTWANGESFDESMAWKVMAPEAMEIAKRFQLLTDHPWTTSEAYGEKTTVFGQSIRKEAWLKEKWADAVEKVNKKSFRLNDFQDTVDYIDITRWVKKIKAMDGQHVIAQLKVNEDAWESPHAVAMALTTSGTAAELKEWIQLSKKKWKSEGRLFDVNLSHPSVANNTLMDQILSMTPKLAKPGMANVLIEEGAILNRKERCGPGQSEYALLMNSMSESTYEEAKEWVKWLGEKMVSPGLSFNSVGQNELASAITYKKINWAGALLAAPGADSRSLDLHGNDFAHYWSIYKNSKTDDSRAIIIGEPAFEALEKAMPKSEQTIQRDANFWLQIDEKLGRLGSIGEQKSKPASEAAIKNKIR